MDVRQLGRLWLIAFKHSFVIISGASTACVIQCQQAEGPKVWHFA